MRDVLRGSLSRSLGSLAEEDRLAAAWPVACGSALAARSNVLGLSPDRVLAVRVADREWMAQFIAMRGDLQRDVARIAGVRLTGIHFESVRGPLPSIPSRS